jgi:hypothetical protein
MSVGNRKCLDISLVIAFQKGLQSPPFVVDICESTGVVETTCT